jgi:diaminohydroxyphosphoribosylaminopyrimidine deaminase / 5-amino-6-(5-phosphoribosylamino)uracil reductase
MRRAVDEARRSVSERGRLSPMVGAVVVGPDGEVVASAHRGKSGGGRHAEFCALLELAGGDEDRVDHVDLTGATVFTTLEPCTSRGKTKDGRDKIPCVERLIQSGVGVVWIGRYDPNPRVYRLGYQRLLSAGIEVRDFTPGLRAELLDLNSDFVDQFRRGTGVTGSATFDYSQQDGVFFLFADSHPEAQVIETRWTPRGQGSIYGYSGRRDVALARGARSFDDIDDPSAFEFASTSEAAREGELLIFRTNGAYAVVRIDRVLAQDRGDDHTSMTITWELRLPD